MALRRGWSQMVRSIKVSDTCPHVGKTFLISLSRSYCLCASPAVFLGDVQRQLRGRYQDAAANPDGFNARCVAERTRDTSGTGKIQEYEQHCALTRSENRILRCDPVLITGAVEDSLEVRSLVLPGETGAGHVSRFSGIAYQAERTWVVICEQQLW